MIEYELIEKDIAPLGASYLFPQIAEYLSVMIGAVLRIASSSFAMKVTEVVIDSCMRLPHFIIP